MKYIHYWRFSGNWFHKINENPKVEKCAFSGKYLMPYHFEYYVDDSGGLTERQVKELLSTRYPECEFVKEVPFHQGARWFGNKKGSEY